MIVRLYELHSAEGRAGDLLAALESLAKLVREAGCEQVQILRDRKDASRFVFLENWTDDDAYRAGGAAIPKTAFAPVMEALAGPPAATTLETASA